MWGNFGGPSEFRGGGLNTPKPPPPGTPLIVIIESCLDIPYMPTWHGQGRPPFTFPDAQDGTKLHHSYAIPQQNSQTPEISALISYSTLHSQCSGSHENKQQTADSPMCIGHQYTRFSECQFCFFSYHFVALFFKIMAM